MANRKSNNRQVITKDTVIPIGIVFSIIIASIWIGNLASEVKILKEKDSPSRYEFDAVNKRLESIDSGIQEINLYLRQK